MNPWECPRCKRISASWVAFCDCKPVLVDVHAPAGRPLGRMMIVEPESGVVRATSCPLCGKLVWNGEDHACSSTCAVSQ